MPTQYLRKCSIVVGDAAGNGIDFSTLRCTFHVRRGDIQTPNSADVRIYNVAPSTANQIQQEFAQIAISAGYKGSFGLIFRGTIKQVRKGRVDAKDSYVDITAADGDSAYNFSTMALSLASGSTPADSLQTMVQSLTQGALTSVLPPAAIPALSKNAGVRGRSFYGMTRDELRDFCRSQDIAWSIQNGRLQFVPLTGFLPGEVPVLSPNTGLIGVPEHFWHAVMGAAKVLTRFGLLQVRG